LKRADTEVRPYGREGSLECVGDGLRAVLRVKRADAVDPLFVWVLNFTLFV
jgi:hypothetical protein